MKTLFLISILFIVIGEFVNEGLFHREKKNLSKIIQVTWLLNFVFIWKFVEFSWLLLLICFVFRVLFGVFIWNISAGEKLQHIGTTCFYDKYIEKYIRIAPVWYGLLFLLIILIIKYFTHSI